MSTEVIDNEYLISKCCNAFTVIQDKLYICTRCGKPCKEICKGDKAIICNKYNTAAENTVNDVYNVNLWHDAMNWYDDGTLMTINVKCPDCKHYMKFARDLTGAAIHICTNAECRHVYRDNKRVDNLYKAVNTKD